MPLQRLPQLRGARQAPLDAPSAEEPLDAVDHDRGVPDAVGREAQHRAQALGHPAAQVVDVGHHGGARGGGRHGCNFNEGDAVLRNLRKKEKLHKGIS